MSDKISKLLGEYEDKQKRAKAAQVAAEEEKDRFSDAFKRWRAEIAHPAFEKLKTQFVAAGHDARIELVEARLPDPRRGGGVSAGIRFSVAMKNTSSVDPSGQRPGVAYTAEEYSKKVHGRSSTPGMSGPIGTFSLEQLTAATIEKHVEDWFAQFVRGYQSL